MPFGGHIVKLLGDGVVVEFPSVVEAVQCAVDVQMKAREGRPWVICVHSHRFEIRSVFRR